AHAAVELVIFQLGEDTKPLGVALEVEKVVALYFTHRVQPASPGGLLKPVADGILAGVAERRVADVMRQAGGLHDHAQVGGVAPGGQFVAQYFADTHAQGAAHAADFQRMGQAGMDVVVAGDRMYLRLAAQTAEGAGKDYPVVIFVKRATAKFFAAMQRLAETFSVEQGLPVHGLSSSRGRSLASTLMEHPASEPRNSAGPWEGAISPA